MASRFADFWKPSGKIGRGTYAVVGVAAFAVKRYVDLMVAGYAFHHRWTWAAYWFPARDVRRITEVRGAQAVFLGTMVAISLPFIWLGVTMTLKRLRSARLPLPLVLVFFVPFVNLLFFLLLCILPERDNAEVLLGGRPSAAAFFARMIPESSLGSAAMALAITAPFGVAMVWFGVRVFTNYGWGIFVALPFTVGFVASAIYGLRQPRSLRSLRGSCVFIGGAVGSRSAGHRIRGRDLPDHGRAARVGAGIVRWHVRIPGAAAAKLWKPCSCLSLHDSAVCAGYTVDGAHGGETGARFCGTFVDRCAGAARRGVEAGSRFQRDWPAE